MKICETCTDRTCEKTGRPCKDLEELLRKEGIYRAEWIRPKMSYFKRQMGEWKEIPFSIFDNKNDLNNPKYS
jgi:hypothetical protein